MKILCAVAIALVLLGAGGMATIVYFVVGYVQGAKLADEGYVAVVRGNYDLAISRYDAALKKTIGSGPKAYAYLNQGIAYNSKKDFEKAIRDFTAAIKLNPQLGPAYAARGWAYRQKGEVDNALADLDQAIRLDPNSKSAHYDRGSIFYDRKQFDLALADFDESARCNPNRPDGLIMRALCYLEKNDLDRALASLDGAIMLEPHNDLAHFHRAEVYRRIGDFAKAFKDEDEAGHLKIATPRATAPKNHREWHHPDPLDLKTHLDVDSLPAAPSGDRSIADSYSGLSTEALLAYQRHDYDRSIALNNAVLRQNITPAQASIASMNRGNAYRGKNEWDKAMGDYDEAIKLNPGNAGAYVDRATALWHAGDRDGALKDLAESLRIDPRQWQAYFNRSCDLRDEERFDEALADLGKVIGLNPKFADAYITRAGIFYRQGKIDNALYDSNMAVRLEADSPAAYSIRAGVYVQKKQYAKAEEDLQKLIQLQQKEPANALNSLAWFRATCPEPSMRDGHKAIENALKACELSKWNNWGFIDTLAAAYAEVGDFDQAVKFQNQAIEQTPPRQNEHVAEMKERLTLYRQHKAYREIHKGAFADDND